MRHLLAPHRIFIGEPLRCLRLSPIERGGDSAARQLLGCQLVAEQMLVERCAFVTTDGPPRRGMEKVARCDEILREGAAVEPVDGAVALGWLSLITRERERLVAETAQRLERDEVLAI